MADLPNRFPLHFALFAPPSHTSATRDPFINGISLFVLVHVAWLLLTYFHRTECHSIITANASVVKHLCQKIQRKWFTAAQCWPVLKIERYQFERWFGFFVLVGQTWNSFPFHFFIIYHSLSCIDGIVDWQPKPIFQLENVCRAWRPYCHCVLYYKFTTIKRNYEDDTLTPLHAPQQCSHANEIFENKKNLPKLGTFALISNYFETCATPARCLSTVMARRALVAAWDDEHELMWNTVALNQCPSSDAVRQHLICHFFPQVQLFSRQHLRSGLCWLGYSKQRGREIERTTYSRFTEKWIVRHEKHANENNYVWKFTISRLCVFVYFDIARPHGSPWFDA